MTQTLTRAAERLSGLFRPSRRRIAVKAIADAHYMRGYEKGRRDALSALPARPETAAAA
jgi:hypothetical protein